MNTFKFNDLEVGHKESFTVRITSDMMSKFKDITGDINPLHNDKDFAVGGGYKDIVVYGMLVSSFYSTLAGVYLPGENSLIQSIEVGMPKPTYVGDTLTVNGEIVDKIDAYHLIEIKIWITNQDGKKVSKGKLNVVVLK